MISQLIIDWMVGATSQLRQGPAVVLIWNLIRVATRKQARL